MREFKFRAWDSLKKIMFMVDELGLNRNEIYAKGSGDNFCRKGLVLMQFTGLHDKNGVEIYEGDILKIKYDFSSGSKDYYHEGFYKVIIDNIGLRLVFQKTTNEDFLNQIPIISIFEAFKSITTDGLNGNYENMAIERVSMFNMNYTNDIEIVGNIYQDKEIMEGKQKD